MALIKEHKIERIYWTIGMVAIRYGIAQSKVRHWCQELEIEPPRSHRNDRRFNTRSIEELHLAWVLVEKLAFTLPGARTIMSIYRMGGHRSDHIVTTIRQLYESVFEESFPQSMAHTAEDVSES